MKQQQFLDVVSEAIAHERFDALCAALQPRTERLPLGEGLLGRTLAEDVAAPVDVPAFDRSNVDGFAIQAADSYGAEESDPRRLRVLGAAIAAGEDPSGREVEAGGAIPVATGAVIPRGADAVIMVEDTWIEADGGALVVQRGVAPGAHISWAGTDLGRGELVLPRGTTLSSRETGLLAAIGVGELPLVARPRVGIASTGDEIRAPGGPLRLGQIYDSNARIVADAVTEAGGEPRFLGIIPDDAARLRAVLTEALTGDEAVDILVLSGGTSKGAGDLNAAVVTALAEELPGSAGVIVHGVALKPGKPLCLAGVAGKPVAILPGFPTSAIFTFHEFLAPLIRRLAGRGEASRAVVEAISPLRLNSVPGRTQYSLVNLVSGPQGLAAYPLGAGSGSVSTFSRADGFVRIPQHQEYLEAQARVDVQLLGTRIQPADLIAIGSHCIALDALLAKLSGQGIATKRIAVGSQAGLEAVGRGEGDVAGTHLLDPESGVYNAAFLPPGARLFKGYRRRQGLVFHPSQERFAGLDIAALQRLVAEEPLRMVNRNRGSGTRALIDGWLGGARPPGYEVQARSHHAVAAAVAQGRADWGITLEPLARELGLSFVFLADEEYDLAIPEARWDRPAVAALRQLLRSEEGAALLSRWGFVPATTDA